MQKKVNFSWYEEPKKTNALKTSSTENIGNGSLDVSQCTGDPDKTNENENSELNLMYDSIHQMDLMTSTDIPSTHHSTL